MTHVVLKRARRNGEPDEVRASERAYEKARVAYAEMRNSSAALHGKGVATHVPLLC